MASTHVIFKLKDGTEKKLYLPLAQSLERKEMGKIVGEVLSDEQKLKKREAELDKREKELDKREKALAKPANKEEKAVKTRSKKAE